jgi:predicted Rossmann fold flavoprotein
MSPVQTADVAIAGAGAAGLMTAIACRRRSSAARVVLFDGARTLGAKILVSGGGRCNVTNREVGVQDFNSGVPRTVRDVLRAFPAARTIAFFHEIGVALHEEQDGKLFPDTNRARTVLDALLGEAGRLGVEVRPGHRVLDVRRADGGFAVTTAAGEWHARAVVLATGGRSLPKSGSDGFGYELARRLGHGHVETTPALVPLILGDEPLRALSGVSHPAAVTVSAEGREPLTLRGSLLWTHFGASGPVILDASRHWHRAVLEGRQVQLEVNVLPGVTFEALEEWWRAMGAERPRAAVATVLASVLPASVADAWTAAAGVGRGVTLAHLPRDDRRALTRALLGTRLDVRGSRGYTYAEATAGGVPLGEIDPRSMESRRCAGLYLVGEILDVDGRLGGFNFQWAWSSGWVAGRAVAAALGD